MKIKNAKFSNSEFASPDGGNMVPNLNETLFPADETQFEIIEPNGEEVQYSAVDDEPFEVNDQLIEQGNFDDITPAEKNVDVMNRLNGLVAMEENNVAEYSSILAELHAHPDSCLADVAGLETVINSILVEKNHQVGKLKALLNSVNPHASDVFAGEVEGKAQIAREIENSDVIHPCFNNNAPAQPEVTQMNSIMNGLSQLPVQSFPKHDSNMQTMSNTNMECSGNDVCTVIPDDDDFDIVLT